ncbi:MAG: vitamin B12-dependent ribonucleotide reductase, partial [Thermoguttaceae bacterium]
SGGKTRRAAKMQSLKVTHPDIMEFVDCKLREEEKGRLLMQHGLSYDDAYSSILYQNANLSVRLTDDFMQSVKDDTTWQTRWVTDHTKVGAEYPARVVFDKISQTAWACGDPGVQYDTTINKWHTCPQSGRINASNPCSEYMFIDDSACNLASINLMKFRTPEGLFDHKRFTAACRIIFIAQEIIVDRASYPIKKIAENSHRFRALGLGYTNLGSLIMSMGLPYDSEESRGLCSVLTALMNGAAYRTSAEIAGVVGTFAAYPDNRDSMLNVMDMHWDAVNRISMCPKYLKSAARELWDDVLEYGKRNGFRNAQSTVLAPTGTISFMMDCDTTGIEPDIALVKFKQLAGGGTLKIVNNTVPLALTTLGYSEGDVDSITKWIEDHGTIAGAPTLLEEHLPVFDCAFPTPGSNRCIAWEAHVRMMAAAQPFISGAISKTVNMPNNATVEDVANAYMLGWELGLKALAVYRDGSKSAQPLSTKKSKTDSTGKTASSSSSENNASDNLENTVDSTSDSAAERKRLRREAKEARLASGPRRERLPDTRQSITHKFNIAGHEGYITVGLYPDYRPGELFITMAKEGSTIGGLMDCFGTAISMSLQYGVPLKVYAEKFSHTRFEPQGYTKNPDIPIAKSIVDYIFRWLDATFLSSNQPTSSASSTGSDTAGKAVTKLPKSEKSSDAGVKGKEKSPESGTVQNAKPVETKTGVTESHPVQNHSTVNVAEPVREVENHVSSTAHVEKSHAVNVAVSIIDSVVATAESSDPVCINAHGEASGANDLFATFQSDAPACDSCGAICVRAGNCYLCHNCGKSLGCS